MVARTRLSWLVAAGAVVIALSVLTGCAGSSGDAASDPGGESSTTVRASGSASTTVQTTTTSPGAGATADAKTQRLAAAGTLYPDDFGTAWSVWSKERTPIAQGPATSGCGIGEGSPFGDLTRGAIQAGPTMQLEGERYFVASSAFAFPDAAAAKREIAVVNEKAWATCKRGELQRFQDLQARDGAAYTVSLDTRSLEGLGLKGFESYARFMVRDAKGALAAYTDYSFYRIGRVVIRVQGDTGAIKDPEAYQAAANDVNRAVAAAYNRVLTLQSSQKKPSG